MRWCKRALIICLAAASLVSVLSMTAAAANKPDAVTQSSLDSDKKYNLGPCGNGPCVYYSLYRMVLRRMDIDGVGTAGADIKKFQKEATGSTSDDRVKDTPFTYTVGKTSYTIARTTLHRPNYACNLSPLLRKGTTISANHLANADQVREMLIRQLSLHPEGIVVYRINDGGDPIKHAVLLTEYHAASGLFYCIDPNDDQRELLADGLGTDISGSAAKRQTHVLQRLNSIYIITKSSLPADKTFTVKYDAGGGVGTMEDSTFTYGQDAILRPCTFTREGYRFKGWWALRTFDNRWRCKTDSAGWAVYNTKSEVVQKGHVMVWANQAMFDLFGITEPCLYEEEASVKNLGLIDGGSITFKARWEKIEEPETPEVPDQLPPELQRMTITPAAADPQDALGAYVRPGAALTVEMAACEEQSGQLRTALGLFNPDAGRYAEVDSGWLDRREDGIYTFSVPAPVESGPWRLIYAVLEDGAGNRTHLTDRELETVPWFVVGAESAMIGLWEQTCSGGTLSLSFTFSYSMPVLMKEIIDLSGPMPVQRESSAVFALAWYTADRQLLRVESLEKLPWNEDLVECEFAVPKEAAQWSLMAMGTDWQPLCIARCGTVLNQ